MINQLLSSLPLTLTPPNERVTALRVWVRDNVFVHGKRLLSKREIERYMRATAEPKLNVGAGGNRTPGWLNTDLYPPPGVTFMDAALRWPFEDGSLHAILCEHMIEHVPKALGIHLLEEMQRTLKPGGWLRVVTPDLNWLATRILEPAPPEEDAYLDFVSSFMKRETTTWCDAVNLCFYEHGHRYIWSIEELKSQLLTLGFSDLTVTRAAHPSKPVFFGVEGHPKLMGVENDAMEAFAIEAMVPI